MRTSPRQAFRWWSSWSGCGASEKRSDVKLTEEALAEWREHPVTLRLLGMLRREVETRKEWMLSDFWNGSIQEWAEVEAERRTLRSWESTLDQLEAASADELTQMEDGLEQE